MRHWKFWEWTAYGALFVAALIIAADTGFKTSPEMMTHLPEFFHSVWWGFSPVTLVLLATIILLMREFVFSNGAPHPASASKRYETNKREREFVGKSIDAAYFASLYKDHTSMQVDGLTRNYLGKWMRIAGTLSEVRPNPSRYSSMTFEAPQGFYYGMHMYFLVHIGLINLRC